MEKLLIAQALDQRDLLKKKINDTIKKMKFVVVCKEKDDKINGRPIADIEQQIVSDWQSVQDMIDRYNRINKAIIQSNAVTTIEFSDGTVMTKAEAIALKKKNDFFDDIFYRANGSYNESVIAADKISREFERTREGFIQTSISGTDKKNVDEETIETINKAVSPFAPKWIDPLNIQEKIAALQAKNDQFHSEVETLIKISNATTYIEF